MQESHHQSIAVIGGGIVGLAVARELLRSYPGLSATVFEKEAAIGSHQTGHNSGVVHAGLYYMPGSLKAALCLKGAAMMREYCAEHGIECSELGKLVIARDAGEMSRLLAIKERAEENGVKDLALLDGTGVAAIEPFAVGHAGLHSPHSAVVNFGEVARHYAAEIVEQGGAVRTSSPVTKLDDTPGAVRIVAGGQELKFDGVVVCAGLSSDRVAALVGGRGETRTVPFRGEYYRLLPGVAHKVRGLIYPVPDPRYPFLGVHLTRRIGGEVLAGPNAVLALSSEGYRWRDVAPADVFAMLSWPGSRRLFARNWKMGIHEMTGSLSKRAYLGLVRRYVPSLELRDLERAPAGVRAQAVSRTGTLVDDFVIARSGRVLLVRNAPSPAATSSLAIAEHVAPLATKLLTR